MTDLGAKRRALEEAVRMPYEGDVWACDPAAPTMALADAYANARALVVWERFELGLGLLIQPPGGLPHEARIAGYQVEGLLRRIHGELAEKPTFPPPTPRSTEEEKC